MGGAENHNEKGMGIKRSEAGSHFFKLPRFPLSKKIASQCWKNWPWLRASA